MIFHLHIPKTGGSTLVDILSDRYGEGYYRTPNRLLSDPILLREVKGSEEVRSKTCISGHFDYGVHKIWEIDEAQARYITFIRDPLDRLLSLYHYLKNEPPGHKYRDEVNSLSFDRFSTSRRKDWIFLDNDAVRRLGSYNYFGEINESHLEAAVRNISKFFFVGLTERYDEGIKALSNKLGWGIESYESRFRQPDRLKREELKEETVEQVFSRQKYDYFLYDHVVKNII